MCRFLLAKFNKSVKPQKLLKEFAKSCEASRTLDGDTQKDGYGIAYQINNKWEVKKSLKPIWEELELIESIPETLQVVAHARRASFSKEIGDIECNQPFLSEDRSKCFVFNGSMTRVTLNTNIPGKIGSQKIWFMIQEKLNSGEDEWEAISEIFTLLKNNSKEINGFNIGIATLNKLTSFSDPSNISEYFQLYKESNDEAQIICSEKINYLDFD